MKYLTTFLMVGLAVSTLSASVRSEPITASGGWNNSIGFQSAYEKAVKDNRADLIEKAENGFYDGFNTYNYYVTNSNVGAQTIISDSILIDSIAVATNCGSSSAQAQQNSHSVNANKGIGDLDCKTGVGND